MIITRTPFRISFFGGGTDYPAWYRENGGAVLSASINKYCYLTCRHLPPFFEHRTRVVWSKVEMVKDTDEIEHPAVREIIKFLNIKDGLEIHHDADLPAKSGLGSSSSFAVGLLHGLYALMGKMVTKRQLALDAMHIEQERLKENVGSQDQTAAAFGGLNMVEFGGPNHITVNPVTLASERLEQFQDHLILFFTGLSRNASDIAAEQVRLTPQKKDELHKMHSMVNDAMHILSGNGSFEDFGKLLHESWQVKRTLSSQISSPHLDEIYEMGRKAGAWGGKLLGAGGGGFMLFFAPPERHPEIRKALSSFLHVPVRFENTGSQIIHYAPSSIIHTS